MKKYLPLAVGVALFSLPLQALATSFSTNNLVTDDQSVIAAQITDPGLVNAWGMSSSPSGPLWVSANGNGTSMIYQINPVTQATTKAPLEVSIPGAGNVTGQAFNGNPAAFHGDSFLFVSEDGTVSGWRGSLGSAAETIVSGSDANVYKGSAVGTVSGNTYLYAANFKANTIDVVKGTAGAPALSGSFTDPNLPSGYAPFNIQNLKGSLYVTYAATNGISEDELHGPGLGIVDKYDLNGNFVARVATGNALNAPWGEAFAPSTFGDFAGALLVGNFGDGHLNAFDSSTYAFLGQLSAGGTPLTIDGLWGIKAGNGGKGGNSNLLYFSAGPGGESHGLVGSVTPVPEPASMVLLGAGFAGLAAMIRRKKAAQGSAQDLSLRAI